MGEERTDRPPKRRRLEGEGTDERQHTGAVSESVMENFRKWLIENGAEIPAVRFANSGMRASGVRT